MTRVASFAAAFLATLLVLLTPPMRGHAQTPTFRSGALTVPIYATAVDATGRLVPDLKQEQFQIYDNGVLQPLTVFRSDIQPITVVVMLDTSGSMTFNFEFLKTAAEQFILRMLPTDRGRIGSFSDRIYISPQFTNDRDELIRLLHDIQFGNPTFLWDAIDDSMTALEHQSGRRVVLVFTDGADDKSRGGNFDEVLQRAENEEFMIYAIGLQSKGVWGTTKPDHNLKKLPEVTGGGYFELTKTADLNTTFSRVADELHRQYVLGFSPPRLDGLVHKLEVRVNVPGVTVRARKSYLAADPESVAEPAASSKTLPRPASK